mmetsp:Transcript_97995/g.158058  ORF Transcript_97995/g.158058 Transcript_97995/m.158058 type:complete len:450 (-) Transcript_97995:59-1408(-)
MINMLPQLLSLLVLGGLSSNSATSLFHRPPCFCASPLDNGLRKLGAWRSTGHAEVRRARICSRGPEQTNMVEPKELAPTRISTANPLHMPAEGLWWAPSFSLGDISPPTRVIEDEAASALGAVRIAHLLSREESAAMVSACEQMAFVQAESSAERRNGALSWALHDNLTNAISARLAPHVARSICSHRGEASKERRCELLQAESLRRTLLGASGPGGLPLVRRCDGAPEGTYRLAGINSRCRVYRYEPDGRDSFASHYDEVWPGSRLVMREGESPQLEYDSWTYGEEEAEAWQWGPSDRVSHLSLLIYLNDGFRGGETALIPDNNNGPSQAVCLIAPEVGDALCFGQSFQLGRNDVGPSEMALLHEGRPLMPPASNAAAPNRRLLQLGNNCKTGVKKQKGTAAQRRARARAATAVKVGSGQFENMVEGGVATAKYVLRSDVLYWMPPPE